MEQARRKIKTELRIIVGLGRRDGQPLAAWRKKCCATSGG
jgi:hypothetical protein